MGNTEKARRRTKSGVSQALDLHRELNPSTGAPIIVAIDQATGQLFFTAARGLSSRRGEVRASSVASMVYAAWPQLRPSA